MQVSESLIPCAFCHKSFPQGEIHDCVTKIFSILNAAAQENKKAEHIFDDVDNMVFQGGAMLGLAYLGMMKRLDQLKPGIFANLKRVAGNSAGSILALYLGLNLSLTEIDTLMKIKYFDLLDTDIALHVPIDPWAETITYKDFAIKDILFTSASQISNLIKDIKNKKPNAEENLKEIMLNVFRYLDKKADLDLPLSLIPFRNWIIKGLAGTAARSLVSWCLTSKQQKYFKVELFQPEATPDPEEKEDAELAQNVSRLIDEAAAQATPEVDPKEPEPETPENEKSWNDHVNRTVKAYTDQLESPIKNLASGEELTGPVLAYAFTELIWFTMISRTDATGKKVELAFFTGNVIKKKLLEGAIEMKFKNIGRSGEYKKGFTFKQLDNFTDAHGKKLFRPFFVTAYNTSNFLTEVFSVYHTPNVVVADAVRASMSFPLFFRPVAITDNGEPRRVYYDEGKKSEIVHYMDGGVLDNYPLWMFDDFKYAFDNIPTFEPTRKHVIQNPKTLGVRFMSPQVLDNLEQPYYDPQETKRKRVAPTDFKDTVGYIGPSLAKSCIRESLENDIIKRGNCPRSIHINKHDVSAFAFNMSPDEEKILTDAGVQAVDDYVVRAGRNFQGEGEKYVH